jgi:hypothetical protein
MRTHFYRFILSAVFVLLLGNSGKAAAQTLTCSSEDGGRHYCSADTRGGVRMLNQRSGSPCRQGYSWGYDRQGVWVDHGCRADFAVNTSAGGWNREDDHGRSDWNGDRNAAQTLTCSSEDGGRHYCSADTRGGVRMLNQRSGSPCREGYSWGSDRRGIWVDHGCRADFAVNTSGGGWNREDDRGRGDWNGDRNGDRDAAQTLTCSSEDGKRHYCSADTRGEVRMIHQRSGSPCQRGYSWGSDRNGVWVDHGCRADFQIGR